MDKKHPNLGKAPPKKHKTFVTDKSKTTTTTKEPTPTKDTAKEATGEGQRRCYICNSPSHLANACPQKATHKANSKKRLNNNKSFMALWRQQLKTPEEQQCASLLLDAWDEDNRCPQCIQPMYFGHECSKDDQRIMQHLDKVQNIFATTSMLHTIEAHTQAITKTQTQSQLTRVSFFILEGKTHKI
jgi:hypothetical protein